MKSSAFSVSSEILLGIKEISELINLLSFISSSQIWERDWNSLFELLNVWVEFDKKNLRLSYLN